LTGAPLRRGPFFKGVCMSETVESKRYIANPGFRFSGIPKFPFETDDKEIQDRIENSFSFKTAKRVWIDPRTAEENDKLEGALGGLNFQMLRKMVRAMGHRDVNKYTKVQLLDILEKEGF